MRTFKVGLPAEHELRKSLTMKSALNMHQLMDRIDKYKRVEKDLIQGKGKVKMFPEIKDPRRGGYQGNHPRGEFPNQAPSMGAQFVNSLFKEPIYHILEKIKNEPYFKRPNKIGVDPSRRNQILYCHYHQDREQITEDCKTLQDHLNQLVRARKLNRFLHQPTRQFGHSGAEFHKTSPSLLARGSTNVILARPRDNGTTSTTVMSVGIGCDMEADDQAPKRAKVTVTPTLGFSEEDK